MSVKSVQFTVAAHIMAALGYFHGEEISSATLADSVNADPTFVRKSLSKLSKAGLVVTKRGKSGASVLARFVTTKPAFGHIPCQCGTTGVCDSFVSGGEEVSGQPQPQGMHVGSSFSNSVQLREIARKNNPGQSGWSDSGKVALTFFGANCADKKNNTSAGLRK